MKPLNPVLYSALHEAFDGYVRIGNQGEKMSAQYVPDWTRNSPRLKLQIVSWGETYCVNCPFCGDLRRRLCINHRWAVWDQESRDSNLQLVTCFNEDCLSEGHKQRQLHALVYPNGRWADLVELPEPPAPPAYQAKVVNSIPPGKPLHHLHRDHPVLRYVEGRGFNPHRLAREYDVRYSPACDTSRPRLLKPRIVIPIYVPSGSLSGESVPDDGSVELVGWQARIPAQEVEKGCPKYLTATGTPKNRLLYGVPYARDTEGPVVLVEGITDAWKVGKCALALLGKSISPAQCRLIIRYFPQRPIIVFLDRDAAEQALEIRDAVRGARAAARDCGTVKLATVPRGRKDPGECTRDEIVKAIGCGHPRKKTGRKKAKV